MSVRFPFHFMGSGSVRGVDKNIDLTAEHVIDAECHAFRLWHLVGEGSRMTKWIGKAWMQIKTGRYRVLYNVIRYRRNEGIERPIGAGDEKLIIC